MVRWIKYILLRLKDKAARSDGFSRIVTMSDYLLEKRRGLFVYDLRVNPITFDFTYALVRACIFFKGEFDLLIIQPNRLPVKSFEYDKHVDINSRQARVINILVGLVQICPRVISLYLCDLTRSKELLLTYRSTDALVYPEDFEVGNPVTAKLNLMSPPNDHSLFRVDVVADSLIESYLQRQGIKNFVVYCVRNTGANPARNSNIEFAYQLRDLCLELGYSLVVVDEVGVPLRPFDLDGAFFCSLGQISVPARYSLYLRSDIVVTVENGPSTICQLDPAIESIIFDKLYEMDEAYIENVLDAYGIQRFEKPPAMHDKCHYFVGSEDISIVREILISSRCV